MAVFRVERIKDYTVMSNHHLRNKNLSLKAKGLLSQMLSLPDDWDYTLKGLAAINKESVDAIRTAIWELEDAGYVVRTRVRDERGCLRGCDYYVYEYPQTPSSGSGGSAESVPPMLEPLASDSAVLGNPMQLNKEIQNTCTSAAAGPPAMPMSRQTAARSSRSAPLPTVTCGINVSLPTTPCTVYRRSSA